MRTIIPDRLDALFPFAGKAADGCHALGAAIGISHNTEIMIRTDLAAAETAEHAFEAALTATAEATAGQADSLEVATAFLYCARDWLKQPLGRQYSPEWGEVGFSNHSLRIPAKIDARIALCRAMELYFTAHPARESVPLNITHVEAGAHHTALQAATTSVNAARTAQRTRRVARDAAVAALRKRLSGLLRELKQLLAPDDPRWEIFGFNIPADHTLPDVPEGLTVEGLVPGHLLANWLASPHAQRYHVIKQVVGVDPEPVFARTTTELSADLNTFSSGAHVLISATALNDAGASLPCEPVEHVVP